MPAKSRKAKKAAPKKVASKKVARMPRAGTGDAARRIDARIASLGDWRGKTLADARRLILAADPDIVEEVKWVKPSNPWGVPVWSQAGIVCTGETYKDSVKLTFARGASLDDPKRLFNASLDGGTRRAIDIHEGEKLDAAAFKDLVRSAVRENLRRSPPKAAVKPAKANASVKPAEAKTPAKRPVLLSGGNPQIPKGDGDAPVQAYIAAMPGWKRDLGKRLDELIVRAVPGVRKAVKWNSPFYGVEGRGWFLSFHVFTNFVKVTFFEGKSLRPLPPGGTPKSKETRWIDVREGALDETQFVAWVKQAAALPGWVV